MRTHALPPCLLLILAALLAALAPAARAQEGDDDRQDRGPAFEVPADLKPDAAELYRKARDAYEAARKATADQTSKIGAAIAAFKKAKEAAPKFPAPCYYLGVLHQWTKDFEKARQVLKLATDLDPKFHQAIVELGDVYLWLKKPDQARAQYDRALAVAPDYAHGYLMRGFLELKGGEFAPALADLETAKKKGMKSRSLERITDMARREVDGPGWKTTFTCETEHYKVMTPVSQALADDIGKHAELIFKTYGRIFPRVSKEKRKFPILVHESNEAYHAAGGPDGAGGHYEPLIRKLVLFQYPKDEDTKLVLYHEGFHQFLHDYLEDAPQWFNEGLGDFFGPSQYVPPTKKGGEGGMRLRPNPWRLKYIQDAINAGRVRGFRQLMLMSQAELYDEQWVGIHYAQSWSIIYFLVRGGAKDGQEAGPYFTILQDYFKALRRGDGQEEAFQAAFGKCDVAKLEAEWRRFTLGLSGE